MTLRRALLVIAAGIGLSFVAARAIERALLAASVLSASRQALIHQARHVVSYVITTRGWTTFELPSGHADVKLETNAVCPRGPVGPGEEVRYALRYRLTSGDETLRDGIYHFRSRRTDFATDEAGIRGERLFFLESEWVPADGRLLRLDLHGLDRGRKELSLRLETSDGAVDHALARVFHQRFLSAAEHQFRWERLSKRKRERVARLDVYSADLLTEEEQRKYTRSEWTAVSPRGVVGRDYDIRILYKRTEDEAEDRSIDEFIGGLRVESGLAGVIPVPEATGGVTLTIERLRVSSSGAALKPGDRLPEAVIRRWTTDGEPPTERRIFLASPNLTTTEPARSGWIEIESTVPIAVRAFLDDGHEITPEASYLRTWVLGPKERLEYRVYHPAREPIELRVDLRALSTRAKLESSSARVHWVFLDQSGKEVRAGDLEFSPIASFYDEVTGGDGTEEVVSDPHRVYFRVEPEVETILLEGRAANIVATLFNRPPEAVAAREIDEDPALDGTAPPAWFIIDPIDFARLRAAGRSRAIRWRPRPPEGGDELEFDEYRATTIFPEGHWVGARVLQRREVEWREERGLHGNVFQEIPANGAFEARLDGAGRRDVVTPTLIVAPTDDEPWQIFVTGDDLLVASEHGKGKVVRLALPELAEGLHRFDTRSQGSVRVFLSHADGPDEKRWLERVTVKIPSDPLRFLFTKEDEGDASLGLWIFPSRESPTPFDVCVDVVGPDDRGGGPHDTWTLLDRRFEVHVPEEGASIVVGDSVHREPCRISLPLRHDLPPGEWLVEVSFPEPIEGLLTLVAFVREKSAIWRFAEEESEED